METNRPPRRTMKRDKKIIEFFNPELHPYVPSNWVTPIIGGHNDWLAKRLTQLTDEENEAGVPGLGYLGRLGEHASGFYKHRVYYRTPKGDKLVNDVNPLRTNAHIDHEVLRAMVHISIQIGVINANKAHYESTGQYPFSDYGIRNIAPYWFDDWPHLKTKGWTEKGVKKYVPEEIFKHRDCHVIRLADGYSRGDGAPCLLTHGDDQLFILTTEIDRNTEHLTGAAKNTIEKKAIGYKEIFDRHKRLYHKHYNFPNSIVPIVTIDEAHMKRMMDTVAKVNDDKPVKYLVFYTWKDWYNERNFPPPTDYIFNAVGKRVNCPDFKLSEFYK